MKIKTKARTQRARWTLRVYHDKTLYMAGGAPKVNAHFRERPSDSFVEAWINTNALNAPPRAYVVTLCYDGKPKATWDVRVTME